MNAPRYAVITPYFKEPRETLERCIESVRRQSVNADHFLVSDGFPQDWVDAAPVTHLRLRRAHSDFGNTPRGIGAMLAIAERYHAVGFLDADNWYDEDHVEACVAASAHGDDVVVAHRRIVRPDGSVMNIAENPGHVDTNCVWLTAGAFHLAHFWLMPAQLAPIGDRVYYAMLQANGVTLRHTGHKTVNYTCQYAAIYRGLGEMPPPGAKESVDVGPIWLWLTGLSEREQRLVQLRCGVDLLPTAREVLAKARAAAAQSSPAPTQVSAGVLRAHRNDKCPCGSGRRYKECHGALR
jgi:hypothetical protein